MRKSCGEEPLTYWDEPYLTDERAKEIATKPFGGHTNSKNDVNVNCDIGVTYNRRIFFGTDGKFQHGHELLPCLGSLGEAQMLRVVELDVPSQCSARGYSVLELTTDRGTYHITNCCYEPADCESWFISVEMPWSSFGKSNDRGIVLCHDIRVSAALVQNGLSYLVPEGMARKRELKPGSQLPLMREEDAWDYLWGQARYASGMDVVWSTLTWVGEKGETVFDPSATGDEAECQRKEIDRLDRELLLRGIVMCPRGPILERVRPWTGVLESLERFQSARRDHYSRLVEVMKGSS